MSSRNVSKTLKAMKEQLIAIREKNGYQWIFDNYDNLVNVLCDNDPVKKRMAVYLLRKYIWLSICRKNQWCCC